MHLLLLLMTRDIPKMAKRSFTDTYFFGYITAIKDTLPTVSNPKAILNFMNKHNLTEDEAKLNTLISTYDRMQREYFEMNKTTG